MSAPHAVGSGPCRVLNAEKLPKGSGGPDSVCSAIERAVAARGIRRPYTAEVHVHSATAMSVALTSDGRKLPEQNFAIMDRNLDSEVIDGFAEVIADVIAGSGDRRN